MSTSVKERLKRMAIEMSREERITLDEALDKLAMQMGLVIVNDPKKEKVRGCDILIEQIPDNKLLEIIAKIKKKKKKQIEVIA